MRISTAGDTKAQKGNESEGGVISGSATCTVYAERLERCRKVLVSECVYYLTDEEVAYKVHAIKGIREQSHKHKQAVAMQSSEYRSSMSKSTANAKRHSGTSGVLSFEASMLELKKITTVANTSAASDGWNAAMNVTNAVTAFKKAGQRAHNN